MSTYGQNASKNMVQVLLSPRDGLFAASCFLHCGFTLDAPLIDGTMVVDALMSWVSTYQGGGAGPPLSQRTKWLDSCGGPDGTFWPPCNPSCPFLPTLAEAPWQGGGWPAAS